MNLSHYTAEPLVLIDRTYEQSARNAKPHGLWVSVDGEDDWPSWCIGEQYGVEWLNHRTPIELTDDANVLTLSTVEEVLRFDAKYGVEMDRDNLWIDWPRVAADYDGIIIAPYQWSLRLSMETLWYYPWDCASGCIWNLSAIDLTTARSNA